MQRLKRAAGLAAILVAAACTADAISPTAPTAGPRETISDAAHSGAVPGFYFLPPMVPQPTYSGTFDAALQPRVEICELSGSTCGPTIATFTFGAGASNVKLDAGGQQYQVNWKTSDYNLDPAKNYRISVYQGAFRLGYADVDVVGAAKDLKNVDTNQFIPLLDDRTLPIKFRIETGIPAVVTVTPASDSVYVGDTKQFTATCTDLHGNAVPCPATTWSSSDTNVATVDGTGLATGVDAGTVTITASIGYAQGTATLKVIQPNTPPVGNDDSFEAIGNVTIPVAAPGVLANDTDAETPGGLSVVPGTVATTNGGTATLAADGSFTYLSAPGYVGGDSFSYTVTDGSLTATATVTMTSTFRVWYADNSAAAPGDGRDASPFAELASAEGASAAGETIFLRYGNGTSAGYDDGFDFKAGQSLTGQGVPSDVTAVVNGQPLVLLQAGSAPTVTNAAAGATLVLATNNVVQGLNVNSTSGPGISGSAFGTFSASDVEVAATGGPSLDLQGGTVSAAFTSLSSTSSAGAGLHLDGVAGTLTAPAGLVTGAFTYGVDVVGGGANVTYGGSIAGSGARAARVMGRTGGALVLDGNITDAGGGILVQSNLAGTISFNGASKSIATGASNAVTLSSNTGATINFGGGGLNLTTAGGTGFSASGGGTVNVTGANNVIASASGTALSVVNTNIGASGLSFRSISAAGDGNGIVLDNTGATNGLQVTGSGSAGSGGTIQTLTGADGSTAGIGVYLNAARNVSLSWMHIADASNFAIRGTGVQNFTLASSVVDGVNGTSASLAEGSISFSGLTGSATISNSSVSGGVTNNVRVVNGSGVLDRLTVSGTTVGANSTTTGVEGFFAQATGSAVLNLTVQNGFFTASRGNMLAVDLQGTSTSDVVLSGNSFTNGSASIIPGAGGVVLGSSGAGANPTLTYSVTGNSLSGASGNALAIAKGAGTGSFSGTIGSNVIGVIGVPNSGSAQGSGISVTSVGGGTQTLAVTNNQIRQYNNMGLLLQLGDNLNGGNGAMNATVTGNVVAQPGTVVVAKNGIHLNAGTITGDSHTVCLAMSGNTLIGSGSGGAAGTDFRLRQRMLTTVKLPGYAGANNDNAAVTLFVQTNNPPAPTGLVQNNVAGGAPGYVGGAACPTP
jgi:hypothetical protein